MRINFNTHWFLNLALMLLCFVALAACSTTRNLQEGETLYTGIEPVLFVDSVPPPKEVEMEVLAALEYVPNNALFGSAYYRSPFPTGLWIYNALVGKKGKFTRWILNTFGRKPVYISTVNPDLRSKVVNNLLRENGYFNATTQYKVLPNSKTSKKAKIHYSIKLNDPYTLDSIQTDLSHAIKNDTIIEQHLQNTLLQKNKRFSVSLLEAERNSFTNRLKQNGYFFFSPEYMSFKVDTAINEPSNVSTTNSHTVWIKSEIKRELPLKASHPWHIGNIQVNLLGYENNIITDTLLYKNKLITYEGKLRVKPELLHKQIDFRQGDLYQQRKHENTIQELSKTGIFRFTGIQYIPRDTTPQCDTLDIRIAARYDYPFSNELEFNLSAKSNQRIGPNVAFGLTRNNVFGGGETFTVKGHASYEWYHGEVIDKTKRSDVDNYEFGLSSTLAFPRNVLWKSNRKYDFVKTSFELSAGIINQANYFKMFLVELGTSLDYRTSKFSNHTFTPFRLRFNQLYDITDAFYAKALDIPALLLRFQDELIPSIEYTYVYSDDGDYNKKHRYRWSTSISEAGNMVNALYSIAGEKYNEKQKELLGIPFDQYIKLVTEFRYNRLLSDGHNLVGRIKTGIIHNYGNGLSSPYSEQFYVGGANSVRAFTMRTIGPGRYKPDNNEFDYLLQTGDFLLEANIEYRFRLFDELYAALFVDAGNVWVMTDDFDYEKSEGHLSAEHFWKDIALGTGVGMRYDMDFFVVRFDVGIGLHVPYDTGKKGYYNIPSFKDGFAFHLAIGYPF